MRGVVWEGGCIEAMKIPLPWRFESHWLAEHVTRQSEPSQPLASWGTLILLGCSPQLHVSLTSSAGYTFHTLLCQVNSYFHGNRLHLHL